MAGNTSVTRNFDRIFTAAVERLQQNVLFDNVSNRIAYLYRLRDMGAIVMRPSSPNISFAIYKEKVSAQGYTDTDTLNIVRGDPITRAIYGWRQLAAPIQVSGLDMIQTGESSVIDLLEIFIQNAEISLRDVLSDATTGLFSANGDSDTRGVTGLQALMSSTPTTGTIGSINRATLTVWQNQLQNFSSAFNTNFPSLTTLYLNCSRGDESVDTIVFNRATFGNYIRSLTSTIHVNEPLDARTADQTMLEIGFPNVRFYGAIIIFDDGVPANQGYFLNLRKKYTQLVVHQDRSFEIGDFIRPANQDSLTSHCFWAGNQVVTNMARQGVALNTDAY